jgi:hypothetical protein
MLDSMCLQAHEYGERLIYYVFRTTCHAKNRSVVQKSPGGEHLLNCKGPKFTVYYRDRVQSTTKFRSLALEKFDPRLRASHLLFIIRVMGNGRTRSGVILARFSRRIHHSPLKEENSKQEISWQSEISPLMAFNPGYGEPRGTFLRSAVNAASTLTKRWSQGEYHALLRPVSLRV